MAFDPNKPLTFNLPDGDCNVMTYEFFVSLMTQILGPINTNLASNVENLTAINARVQYWIDQQSED